MLKNSKNKEKKDDSIIQLHPLEMCKILNQFSNIKLLSRRVNVDAINRIDKLLSGLKSDLQSIESIYTPTNDIMIVFLSLPSDKPSIFISELLEITSSLREIFKVKEIKFDLRICNIDEIEINLLVEVETL